MRILTVFFVLICIHAIGRPSTIYVPDDYTLIQNAIDAAVIGDTIIVRPGTYPESIDFYGKDIHLRSEQGPDVTIIDGAQSSWIVVTFRLAEGSAAIIEGFTITNGNHPLGGGVFCYYASPTIRDNIITANASVRGAGVRCQYSAAIITGNVISDNTADSRGGGIDCEGGTPEITNNEILNNTTQGIFYDGGGGIFCDNTQANIENNTLLGNIGGDDGGGIYCYKSDTRIADNEILYNTAENGGAIYCYQSSPLIDGNLMMQNGASDEGGAICSYTSSPTITRNKIVGNVTSKRGGAIYCEGVYGGPIEIASNFVDRNEAARGGGIYTDKVSPVILNNVITGNQARQSGGGIYFRNHQPVLAHNTICGNQAAGTGGGIYDYDTYSMTIINCIVWENLPDQIVAVSPDVRYSDIQGGWSGSGNIDTDPLFAAAAQFDYHLTYDSPCRNSGYDLPSALAQDFEEDPRIAGGQADMGADEFYPHLYHLGQVVPGGSMAIAVVGNPGISPVTLALGSGVQDPPEPTPYGDLYLVGPFQQFDIGKVPAGGILGVIVTVPLSWSTGEEYPFQALLGSLSPRSELTNLMVLEVQ